MDPTIGTILLVVSVTTLLATAGPLRTRLPRPVVDGSLALAGAGLAVGGLLWLEDVGVASWVIAPLALAVLVPLHVRALFAGEGPLRT